MGMESIERALTDKDCEEIQKALVALPRVLLPEESYRRQRNATLLGSGIAIGVGLMVAQLQRDEASPENRRLLALAIAALLSLLVGVVARLWRDDALTSWRAVEAARGELLGLLERRVVSVWRGTTRAALACGGIVEPGYLIEVAERELLFLTEPPHTDFELAAWPLARFRALGEPVPALEMPRTEVIEADSGDHFALSLSEFLADRAALEDAYQGNLWEDTVL